MRARPQQLSPVYKSSGSELEIIVLEATRALRISEGDSSNHGEWSENSKPRKLVFVSDVFDIRRPNPRETVPGWRLPLQTFCTDGLF